MTVESIYALWLQRLVIGFKISRQFFNQLEEKPKAIAFCKRKISTLWSSYR